MRSGHRDLDRLAREGGHGLEFIDQSEVDGIENRPSADRGGMENIGVVAGDRLGLRLALKGRDLLPEMIEHRVRRRMPVVRAPMHFPAGDDVDAGDFLLEDRGLRGPQLRIRKIARRQLAERHQPVQSLVPSRHAMRADDGGRISFIWWHRPPCATKGCCNPGRPPASLNR